jgi:catechol 2,3-dioxygenase-like lactoylglutathione lyase family enzyme
MLHHVSIGVGDVTRAATFYDPVLKALGYKRVMEFMPYAIGYGETKSHPEFWIGLPHNQMTATAGNGTHVGFSARSKAQVNAFHSAALSAGGSNDGEPGPRPDYGPEYYGAFVYDLDGNKVEATLHVLVKEVAKAAAKKPAKKAKKAKKAKNAKKTKKSPAKKKKRR